MKNHQTDAPILLIGYNRPKILRKVFERVKLQKPKKLYFFVDSPKTRFDVEKCEKCKNLIDEIDWDCDLNTFFPKNNLGCGLGVSSAINWIFESEEKAIILEDDCVPSRSFFYFCQEMLSRYENDTRIWIISGINFFEDKKLNDDSYFFSKYPVIWGWATWKRVWKNFNFSMNDWPSFKNEGFIFDDLPYNQSKYAVDLYDKIFKKSDEEKTAWASQFGFIQWSNRSLGIIPARNLVSNIGYIGTHNNKKDWFHDYPVDENFIIKKHPKFFLRNTEWDNHYFKVFRKRRSLFIKIIEIIKKYLKS